MLAVFHVTGRLAPFRSGAFSAPPKFRPWAPALQVSGPAMVSTGAPKPAPQRGWNPLQETTFHRKELVAEGRPSWAGVAERNRTLLLNRAGSPSSAAKRSTKSPVPPSETALVEMLKM